MGKEEAVVLILSSVIAILLLSAGIVAILIFHNKRKMKQVSEKREMLHFHKEQLLETRLESQQETMQYIGREIHDNVGQKLTLASLYAKQPDSENKMAAIGSIIDESLNELRRLSKSLTNPEYLTTDLQNLLESEAKRINSTGFYYVTISESFKQVALPPNEKNTTFRILQEFLQNSIKHAGCKRIEIKACLKADFLAIIATDDGKGFDRSKASSGIGLSNMKQRAEQINAKFNLTSEFGKGTMLILEIPL